MTPPRFSDDDLKSIITATNLRSALIRDSGPDHDAIDLPIPHGAVYRFQRDATGTHLLFIGADDHDRRLMASGTLAECLKRFDSDPRYTDAELATIRGFARDRGLEAERQGTPTVDRILIHLPDDVGHYRLERDATGSTRLLWCQREVGCDPQELVSGSLDECLMVFELHELPPDGGTLA
jgi:hypothetical protein